MQWIDLPLSTGEQVERKYRKCRGAHCDTQDPEAVGTQVNVRTSETNETQTAEVEAPGRGCDVTRVCGSSSSRNSIILGIMREDGNVTAEKILDLALEIVHLLTREDHVFVKETGGRVAHVRRHLASEIICGAQDPPPQLMTHERQNEQKILELSNQIIRLLTGEVPIRCEDVTVYLSMEEWEYVERHKELYEDVMMDDHQPLDTLRLSKTGTKVFSALETCSSSMSSLSQGNPMSERHAGAEPTSSDVRNAYERTGSCVDVYKSFKRDQTGGCVKEEPASCDGEDLVDIYPTTEHSQKEYRPAVIKEEPSSFERGNLTDTDVHSSAEHAQTEYSSTLKEEPASCDGGDHSDTDVYSSTHYSSIVIKEEPDSSDRGDLSDTVYPPTEDTQTDYTCLIIKEESDSCDGGDLSDAKVYPPTEDTQTDYPSIVIKEEPASWEEENRFNVVLYSSTQQMPVEDMVPGDDGGLHSHFPSSEGSSAFPDFGKCTSLQNPDVFTCHQNSQGKEKTFPCSECGKSFSQKSVLIRHQQIHSGSKPHSCPECGKGFRQKSDLEKHHRIHTGAKPYSCSVCGKSFSQKTHLDLHQTLHTGEKSYSCSECGKCFSHKSYLVSHFRIHTGCKPYSCTVCGKSFSHRAYLSSHNRTHTGFKPHACPDCGKCFSRKSILVTHQRTHTGEKPYPCSECGKCYTQKPHLHLHQKTAHWDLSTDI